MLRNCKKEFLDNVSVVFDDKREENIKEKLASECKEKAAYARKNCRKTVVIIRNAVMNMGVWKYESIMSQMI